MSLTVSFSSEIFIVDDSAETRDALSMIFVAEGYQVTAFRDVASFIAAARARTPACVLLGDCMAEKSALEVLTELDAGNYPARIIILSSRGDVHTVVEAIKAGAYDFVKTGRGKDAIVARVRNAIGRSPDRSQRYSDGDDPLPRYFPGCERLTPRERDVLREIMTGASSKEVARNFGISPRTIEVHRAQILQKLGARNSVDLTRIVFGNSA